MPSKSCGPRAASESAARRSACLLQCSAHRVLPGRSSQAPGSSATHRLFESADSVPEPVAAHFARRTRLPTRQLTSEFEEIVASLADWDMRNESDRDFCLP